MPAARAGDDLGIDNITEAAVMRAAAQIMAVLALLYPLARLSYGREFFLRGIGTQLIANTVPESDGNLTVRSVPGPAATAALASEPKPSGGRLALREALRAALPAMRHGIHSSEQSGEMIAAWLLRQLGSREFSPAPA